MRYIERVNLAVKEGGEGLVEALGGLGIKISRREEIRCVQELFAIQSNKSQVIIYWLLIITRVKCIFWLTLTISYELVEGLVI